MDIWVWVFQKCSKVVALWEVLKIVDFGRISLLWIVDKRASNFGHFLRIASLSKHEQNRQNGSPSESRIPGFMTFFNDKKHRIVKRDFGIWGFGKEGVFYVTCLDGFE